MANTEIAVSRIRTRNAASGRRLLRGCVCRIRSSTDEATSAFVRVASRQRWHRGHRASLSARKFVRRVHVGSRYQASVTSRLQDRRPTPAARAWELASADRQPSSSVDLLGDRSLFLVNNFLGKRSIRQGLGSCVCRYPAPEQEMSFTILPLFVGGIGRNQQPGKAGDWIRRLSRRIGNRHPEIRRHLHACGRCRGAFQAGLDELAGRVLYASVS